MKVIKDTAMFAIVLLNIALAAGMDNSAMIEPKKEDCQNIIFILTDDTEERL